MLFAKPTVFQTTIVSTFTLANPEGGVCLVKRRSFQVSTHSLCVVNINQVNIQLRVKGFKGKRDIHLLSQIKLLTFSYSTLRLFRYKMYITIKFQKLQHFTRIRQKGTVLFLMCTDDSKYEETDDWHEAEKVAQTLMDSPHDEEKRRHMIHRQQRGRHENRGQNTGPGKAERRDTSGRLSTEMSCRWGHCPAPR